ncbi:MAG: DMT family transporter, partial [Chloroflexi bacterium]|nr:DMT family transporter [Chloroflexota bacterium]
PWQIWPYVLVSGLLQAAYFVILAAAYGRGDFSLVYPIARGAAPGLLAIWAFFLLHERLHTGGVVGLGILLIGLVIVGSSAWWKRQQQAAPSLLSVGLALLVALCISGYSASDGAAVKLASPTGYIVIEMLLTTIFVTPLIFTRYRWKLVLATWQKNWLRISLVGILSNLAYLLVLIAYTLSPVGYAGAIREVSIVFAALAGWLWLNERFGSIRAIGASVIFAGILVIAVAG